MQFQCGGDDPVSSPRVARSRPPPWGWGAERACSRSSPRASRARVRLLPARPVPRVRPSSRLPDAADKDSHNPDGGKPTLLIRAVRMASSPRDQDHAARRDTERRFRHLRSLRLQRAHYACACADAEVAALLLDYYQYYPHATAARAGAPGALRVDHVARAVRSATASAAAAAAAGAADAPRAASAAPSTAADPRRRLSLRIPNVIYFIFTVKRLVGKPLSKIIFSPLRPSKK